MLRCLVAAFVVDVVSCPLDHIQQEQEIPIVAEEDTRRVVEDIRL